jgi:hypothetical protein
MPHFLLNHGQSGPLIDMWVAVSNLKASVLTAQKAGIPPPVMVKALVDTGASHTTIDTALVNQLGLSATGIVSMITPSTGNKPVDVFSYDVGLHIPSGTLNNLIWSKPLWIATCADLNHQGFSVLLGRDALAEVLLVYDGRHGTFTMSF